MLEFQVGIQVESTTRKTPIKWAKPLVTKLGTPIFESEGLALSEPRERGDVLSRQ
jgi:hypothetical protein